VCCVECSTAGRFYRHLPRVHDLILSQVGHEQCIQHMMTMRSTESMNAVVFIHGFNCSVHDAMRRLGQLWTIGDFPNDFHPYVFGWPGMKSVMYFRAQENTHDPEVLSDFGAMIERLKGSGYERIHVIAHSLGAGIVLNAARNNHHCIHDIDTLILMNPDYPLHDFEESISRVVAICDHVTVYADATDSALLLSVLANRRRCIGRSIHMLSMSPYATRFDVIDVSWMDANIPFLRHTFFHLNRLIVDDVREILTTRRRAEGRFHLVNNASNVWSFMYAPVYVR